MYRSIAKTFETTILVISMVVFAVATPILSRELPFWGLMLVAGTVFVLVRFFYDYINQRIQGLIKDWFYNRGDTRLLVHFVDRLRFCFTIGDLISAFREILEKHADSTIMFMEMTKRYMVYNSPTIIGMDQHVFDELVRHYESWKDGIYFFDDNLDLVSNHRIGRGFFLVSGNLHCYVFMRFVRNIDKEIFPEIFAEYANFLKRNETIEKMFAIAAVSKEWSMVAETQRAFLPKKLPEIPKVELASYFKPLVNVSGDYYDVLPIDTDRTLLLLGDVSGKGLAAALIMGIVVNTIRIMEKKDELEQVVRTVDGAIKGMKLQDKYTVLFLGLLDTQKMELSYINASMADPLIISETKAGRQIRRLGSNCSVIGILDLDSVGVDTVKLLPGDVILMASDGVSEVSNEQGEMLGDTEGWIDFVVEESRCSAQEFVQKLSDLVITHASGTKLRDDVTVLVAKVQE
ncbi:PP2C family protein-serine/threonine phosphatase [Gracilinema caldarium]|uniref:Protein serine/threonine phosphatase n=1 Tax=Gracilinema caldarium (strain ATCC 51460 / DSM 7334 / H1) TaxID=744872 RepID=F8F142_GRAC1|nr:PP2C family protein-serine/threonine phosphatase [Gracilinema caldarium]AEJ20832.1 protein serine/threonine phosphatase [Gracilinema caldarium DSM 7334]